jgi:hypothetical protein
MTGSSFPADAVTLLDLHPAIYASDGEHRIIISTIRSAYQRLPLWRSG